MISKIKSLIWFIRNPGYKGQIIQILKRRISIKGDNHAQLEALKWCQDIEISEAKLIKELINQVRIQPLELDHKNYYAYAKRMVSNVPVKMGGAGAIDFLYQLAKYIKAKYILETGVAYGWSSLAFLLSSKEVKLYSVDMPYLKMNNEEFVGIAVHPDLRENWKLLRMADRRGIPSVLKEGITFDIIHYDSDKSYAGRKWAYPRLWNALKSGGYLISDDIQDNIAFKEFCDHISKKPWVFQNNDKYVGLILKD